MNSPKKPTLGRGLADLLGQARANAPVAPHASTAAASGQSPATGEQLLRLPGELVAAGSASGTTRCRGGTGRRLRRTARLPEEIGESASEGRLFLRHVTAPACRRSSRRSISPASAR